MQRDIASRVMREFDISRRKNNQWVHEVNPFLGGKTNTGKRTNKKRAIGKKNDAGVGCLSSAGGLSGG
jgi:hypothetical protein